MGIEAKESSEIFLGGVIMLASVLQDGLKMTVTPGFSWDKEMHVFRGPILYGDEILSLCVTRERMQRSINGCLDADEDIEALFDPAYWVAEAERLHVSDVYFEDEDDLGPDDLPE
jgi:hypothetical protein